MRDILKSRGWKISTDACHVTYADDPKHKETFGDKKTKDDNICTVFLKEFEACLEGQKPEKLFGKRGSVEEGYQLRALKLPKRALWMLSRAAYRVPGTANGRAIWREDFAKIVVEHGESLPREPSESGNYRICKFPGMEVACYKTNLSLAFREKPWYPVAYVLPREKDTLLREMRTNADANNYWIAKPKNDYGGSGIRVYHGSDADLAKFVRAEDKRSLVQSYLANPLLLSGYKFHMRVHMVITSLNPPKGYLQPDGQCLFATLPYTLSGKTLGAAFSPPVHVTNQGLNATPANKENFMGEKPTIGKAQQIRVHQLMSILAEKYPSFDKQDLWGQITGIAADCVKYIAKAPSIRQHGDFVPNRHFEILGMDIMLDKKFNAYLCEINTDPGLGYVDKEILGTPNPDYHKEMGTCTHLWHGLFSLLGMDAGRRQPLDSLQSWYELDCS